MSKPLNKKLQEINSSIMKALLKSLSLLWGDKHDSDDIAYVLANAYFKEHNLKLCGNDIYEGNKAVGELTNASFKDNRLDLTIRINEPLHSITVDFKIEDTKEKKKK